MAALSVVATELGKLIVMMERTVVLYFHRSQKFRCMMSVLVSWLVLCVYYKSLGLVSQDLNSIPEAYFKWIPRGCKYAFTASLLALVFQDLNSSQRHNFITST